MSVYFSEKIKPPKFIHPIDFKVIFCVLMTFSYSNMIRYKIFHSNTSTRTTDSPGAINFLSGLRFSPCQPFFGRRVRSRKFVWQKESKVLRLAFSEMLCFALSRTARSLFVQPMGSLYGLAHTFQTLPEWPSTNGLSAIVRVFFKPDPDLVKPQ